ncbi:uncharacterized protein PV09_01027 [Verruconis gallopava]|uniref:RCC1-like domain-containing protein n=1 Tax=Verruconis gallopava TaxID=253628 RepID=A0A0D1Z547_9PEZI|nr:uncharacterized protein PV09_01027 [Verruconis gallopava]KIW08087.1 hypothetical protein PV09_01027 [Verruconis gallopava]
MAPRTTTQKANTKAKMAAAPPAATKRSREEAEEPNKAVKRVQNASKPAAASKNSATKSTVAKSSSTSKPAASKKAPVKQSDAAKPAAKKQNPKPSASKKRARDETEESKPSKRAKAEPKKATVKEPAAQKQAAKKPAKPKVIVNTPPTTTKHIYVMGEGSAGELGLGATKGACNVKRPRLNPILEEKGIVDLAVGGMHCIALTKDNELVSWGVNDNKALGRPLPEWSGRDVDEDASDFDDDEGLELNPYESAPTAIPKEYFPPGTKFTMLAAGDSTSYAVTDEGNVYGWGTYRNAEGIWGFRVDEEGKMVKEQKVPVQITNLKNITAVSCGDNHTLALDNKGVVWAWGSGQQDQLGRRIVARHAEKNLIPAPVPIPKSAKIEKIIAGPNHSFAIEKTGTVWTWGLNNFAQTGIPYGKDKDNDMITAPTKVKALEGHKIVNIGTGANHSIALTEDGDLLTFGRLENYALGIKFDDIVDNEDLVRKNEQNKPKILLKPMKIDIPAKFSFIACGPDHNIAITTDGKAWGWGFNTNLQLGVGRDDDDVKMPEQITSKHIADVKLDWAGCGGQFSMVGASANTSA